MIKPKLRQEEFISDGGSICPFCDGEEIEAVGQIAPSWDSNREQLVECRDCGSKWYEKTMIIGYETMENHQELVEER